MIALKPVIETCCTAHLQHVDDQCQSVADKECQDHNHQHGGHANFTLLKSRELSPFGVSSSNLQVNSQVEGSQAGEGNNVHDYKVEPGDVDADVGGVAAEPGHGHLGPAHIGLGVVDALPGDLEEPGQVVEDGTGPNNQDTASSSAVGT